MDRCGCPSVCRRSRRHQSVSAKSVDVEYNDEDDDCSESSSVVTLLVAEVPVVASTRPLDRCPNEPSLTYMAGHANIVCRPIDTIVVFLGRHIS